MGKKESILEYEHNRLKQIIALAEKQLEQAKERNLHNESAILEAKEEMRENTPHSIGNLWGSEAFEALAALSQYVNPITDKIADYEAVQNRIVQLESMIQSPYFARIDFQFQGEDAPEEIYIGRSSLMSEDAFDICVYDWRSPVASVFYRFTAGPAYYDAPAGRITGEVSLKRQYEIKQGKLEYFFDADVQIIDEFLRKLLSQNTSSKMKTIVETIQKEQDIVIRDMENDLMMVQGVAGSGKTSIALHRAAYLMYQGLSEKLSANDILIISPNALFEQYISNVLPELGEEHVNSLVFETIITSILQKNNIQSRNRFLEKLISNSRHQNRIKNSIEFKTSRQFIEILNRFIEDLPYQWIAFADVFHDGKCIADKEMLREKIISGRKETPLGMKLMLLEEYILELAGESQKKRLRKSDKLQIKEEIQKFTVLNAEELYRRLFQDKEYFYHLARGLELPECIEDILKFTQRNLEDPFLHYDDATVLTYFTLKMKGTNKYRDIKQVVIDEAQDYYPIHFEIFHMLFFYSKLTILGDINQTLEKREDLSLYERIQKIFNKRNSTLVTMNKSFRCTNEILQYSSKFLEQGTEIKSFNRDGEMPRVYAAEDQSSYEAAILAEIRACQAQGYQSVGLICKTEKDAIALFHRLKGSGEIQLIRTESTADLQGVFLIPVYMSKGLEFDAVLICDADSRHYHSKEDKKLLYIACTRALHRLHLFCNGKPSPLVL